MSPDTDAHSDILLTQFYQADEATADSLLGRILDNLRSCVRSTLAERGAQGEDIEDLSSVTRIRLLEALRRSRQPDGTRIQNLLAYAYATAEHVFLNHLRRGRRRHRLKLQVLALLDNSHPENPFARWQILALWLGGFQRWRGQSFRATPHFRTLCTDPEAFLADAFPDREPDHIPLPLLLARLFDWIQTPVEVGELSERLAALLHIRDVETFSLDDLSENKAHALDALLPPAPDQVAESVVSALAAEQTRVRLWQEVVELPPFQRAALLLGLDWSEALLLAGSATHLRMALTLSLEEIATLRPAFPLPDKTIAERLNLTSQQVANPRKCARERLARRKHRWEGSHEG